MTALREFERDLLVLRLNFSVALPGPLE